MSRPRQICDFPPVKLVLLRQGLARSVVQLVQISTPGGGGLQRRLPDFCPRRRVEGRVLDAQMDARHESCVEGVDTVGGEEDDALVVLEYAQEDGHEAIALDIVEVALSEEDVGLVDEDDGPPGSSEVEYALQFALRIHEVTLELAGPDVIERQMSCLGNRFCKDGFSPDSKPLQDNTGLGVERGWGVPAVNVLPVPAVPYKRMTNPLPFLDIMSRSFSDR